MVVNRCRRLNRSLLARGVALVGALALWLSGAPTVLAQNMLNENLAVDAISQSIQLNADNIATWTEAGQQVFLLQGGVIVSQGSNTIRASDGVIWVDMSRFQTERVMNLIVYGENPIGLELNKVNSQANFGYVRLATTNQIDIKAFKSKVTKEDRSIHPVFMRAYASRPDGLALPAPKEIPAARQPIGGDIQQVGGTQPLPPPLPQAPTPFADPKDALQNAPPVPKLQSSTTVLQIPPVPKVEPVPGIPDDNSVPPPPTLSPNAPLVPASAAPQKPPPQISIRPRYNGDMQMRSMPVENGWTAVIVTGGLNLIVIQQATTPGTKATTIDMEADRAVIWTRGNPQQLAANTRTEQEIGGGAHEVYLSGNVEIRTRTTNELDTLRADEVYYDVRRGVAVARKVDLEMKSGKLERPLYFVTDELLQVNPKLYKMNRASISSSIIPSDPGLKVDIDNLTVEEFQKDKSYLFGLIPAYDKDGNRIIQTDRIFTGQNFVPRIEEVPFFYFPYYRANVERPLGPLDTITMSYNKILGMQFYTSWDLFDLLNLPKPDGARWRLFLDYLTERGPGLGTEYDFEGKNLFGVPSKYTGMIKLYGISDSGQDVLGGDRGNVIYWPLEPTNPNAITHPTFRGWAFGNINVQNLPDGFTVLGQFSFLSDRNYLEQYNDVAHLNGPNQDTFLYVKQQQHIWAWTLQGQVGTQDWMTETNWLPKADGYLLGKTFADDWLVYNGHASAGYGQLRPTIQVPYAYQPTDVRADVFRADWMQEVSVPVDVGPVKIAPYVMLDTAYYSQDVNGDGRGRLYGGGGVRWNMPLSRLYPDVQSELLNLNGIYHKINLTGNFYSAYASSGVNNFPQLDRLNDDSTDQALRDIRPWQGTLNPANALPLTMSNLYNPQNYAIRRLIDNNVDTLDNIEVIQLAIDQRWQTKRGFPGNEHVVDYMTLNLGVSIFPQANRDNFGHTFGILEYAWVWNIGDRTALSSSGWFEPFEGGPRVWDFGITFNRPDTTAFYLGYRQYDPLNSKAVIASIIYPFSAKYALQASTVWDFGNKVSSYSLFLSRMGTDVMVNFGLTYNSTVNTFGIAFEILPNLARNSGRTTGLFPMPPQNIDPMVNIR
jgi:lipopolysaccharide export system protein LptA